MPDRVHAAMNAMETTARDTVRDRAAAETQLPELPGRDPAVLPTRQLGHRPVRWAIQCTYFMR